MIILVMIMKYPKKKEKVDIMEVILMLKLVNIIILIFHLLEMRTLGN